MSEIIGNDSGETHSNGVLNQEPREERVMSEETIIVRVRTETYRRDVTTKGSNVEIGLGF